MRVHFSLLKKLHINFNYLKGIYKNQSHIILTGTLKFQEKKQSKHKVKIKEEKPFFQKMPKITNTLS